jgi:uncharacterized membrane protein
METTYEGPLPPPWILERYARLYPDAPRIIFQSFEKQGDHRRALERIAVEQQGNRSFGGLISLTIITIVVLIICAYLVTIGYWIVGLFIAVAMIFALLAANVFGSQQQREERARRFREMMKALTGKIDRPDEI